VDLEVPLPPPAVTLRTGRPASNESIGGINGERQINKILKDWRELVSERCDQPLLLSVVPVGHGRSGVERLGDEITRSIASDQPALRSSDHC
jgi:hypothetical protein